MVLILTAHSDILTDSSQELLVITKALIAIILVGTLVKRPCMLRLSLSLPLTALFMWLHVLLIIAIDSCM